MIAKLKDSPAYKCMNNAFRCYCKFFYLTPSHSSLSLSLALSLSLSLSLSLFLSLPPSLSHSLSHSPSDLRCLKETYIGFLPSESRVFTLDYPDAFHILFTPGVAGKGEMKERIADQLATLCASLGEYPAIRCLR